MDTRCKHLFTLAFCMALLPAALLAEDFFTGPITYQGVLEHMGVPMHGDDLADVRVRVWNAQSGGSLLGTSYFLNVDFDEGRFTVELTLPDGVLNGDQRWLEFAFAVPPGGAYQPLSQRQRVGHAPYAEMSFNVATPLELTDSVSEPVLDVTNSGTGSAVDGMHSATGNVGSLGGATYSVYGATTDPNSWAAWFSGRGFFSDDVGIGTSSPTAALQVNATLPEPSIVTGGGADYATVAGQWMSFGHWDGSTYTTRFGAKSDGTIFLGPNGESVGVGTENPTAKLHVSGTPGVDGIRFPDGTLQTTAASGSGSSLWSQLGSDIYYNSGDVGIGTSSPARPFEVRKQRAMMRLRTTGDSAGSVLEMWNTAPGATNLGAINFMEPSAGWTNAQILGQANQLILHTHQQGNLATRLTLDDQGHVGIGTLSPTEALDVDGDIRAYDSEPGLILSDANGGGSKPYIRYENSDRLTFEGDDSSLGFFGFYSTFNFNRTNDAALRVYGKASGTWSNYAELTHDGTDGLLKTDVGDLVLDPAGYVGIGTSSPTAALQVDTTLPRPSIVTAGGNDYATVAGQWMSFGHWDGSTYTTRFGAKSDGTIILGPNGESVGIGTENPTAKLHIDGTPGVDGIRFPDGTLQTTAATGGGSSHWTQVGNDIYYDSGNVSIGTTSSTDPLKVRSTDAETVRLQGPGTYSTEGRIRFQDLGANVFIDNPADGELQLSANGYGARQITATCDDFDITGSLSKGGGSFKIDHPLDPENKYLYHSFVESPDMMNIYNGNVVTDADGYAVVEMPAWFDALNRDFRYQLTVIGTFAQAIVAEEIMDGRFTIQTDQPGIKVSWQVTGVRQDPWAEANRIPVEAWKAGADRGKYLHPQAWGVAAEQGEHFTPIPENAERR